MFRFARRPVKWLGYTVAGVGGVYIADNTFNDSVLTRATRAVSTLMLISADYKWNFAEGYDIDALHERNSQRLYNLITANKGLYIKIGQMIAIQGSMFPRSYQDKFRQLFDNAPADPWPTVDSVLRHELGPDYMRFFSELEQLPVASASIAQVHRGVLKTGEKVAVKIQHKALGAQVDTDLATYKRVMDFYSWVFDMPLSFVTQYICDTMKEETDFRIEQRNGEKLKHWILGDRELQHKLYVPKVFGDMTTARVMVAEWIEGDSVSEMRKLKHKGYNIAELSNSIVKFYARQAFQWGDVHSDPHPGNFIVRHVNGHQQLVVLDHGLYVHLQDKFRFEYCRLFKALSEGDSSTMREITAEWGIRQGDMFTSMATMSTEGMKEMKKRLKALEGKSDYERQVIMRDQMRHFFESTDKFPLELVFLGRGMRIVQGINHQLGAPVNRIAILSDEARFALRLAKLTPDLKTRFPQRVLLSTYRYIVFCAFRLAITLTYWLYRMRTTVYSLISPEKRPEDIEDAIDKQMVYAAQSMGLQVKQGDFTSIPQ